MIQARFTNSYRNYDGWYEPDETWNGFLCPVFDSMTAGQILTEFVEDEDTDGIDWNYDQQRDIFTLYGNDRYVGESWISEYSRAGVGEINGVPVYAIGAGEWCWELF